MQQDKEKKVLLRISHLKQYFPLKKTKFRQEQLYVRANDDISIDIHEGETFGLVGESGCGKSTFGRTLLQLYHQTDGKTLYYGRDRDSIAPAYVEDTLKNLTDRRNKLNQAKQKREELEREYNQLSEKEQYAKADELYKARKLEHDLFLDITQLIGGFLVVPDLGPVSEAFLKEYHAASECCKLNEEIHTLEVEDNTVRAEIDEKKAKKENFFELTKKSEQFQQQIAEKRKEAEVKNKVLEERRKEIGGLREKYQSLEGFAECEAHRDNGIDLAKLNYNEMRLLRKDLQLIFQDPYSSLNPRMTVGQIIGEGLLAHKFFKTNNSRMQDYVMKVMEDCGLPGYMLHRYPHQFSGGQRQRIGIARSLALQPKFVVCDEAVSALDVSIQSQVINLLQDLKEKDNLTYLFISHDLSVVKYISDRIGVMYLGNMVELAETQEMFANTLHPYTEALLSAIPTTDVDHQKEAIILEGDIPSPIHPPKGCKFHTRCRYCTEVCTQVTPEFRELAPGHFVACHHPLTEKEG